MKLIDKDALVAEIEKIRDKAYPISDWNRGYIASCEKILSFIDFIDTLEARDVDLTDKKTNWRPSNKQIESLRDMLKCNVGVFVNSLYDDLTKILDYETDR